MAKMFIAGESVDSISGGIYEVRNPANGEVVDSAPKGNADDARRAIDAAEAAFDEWSHTSAEDRGKRESIRSAVRHPSGCRIDASHGSGNL